MQVVICDDNSVANTILTRELKQQSEYSITEVMSTLQCIRYMETNQTDVLFLSLCSDQIDYKAIIRFLREKNQKTVIFMIGDCSSQVEIAYQNRCDYFIERPYQTADIVQCAERAELLSKRIGRVAVRTFGRFDVFVNGKLMDFHNAKAKELFALCVDRRGGSVSIEEAVDKLWSNRTYDDKVKKLYRKSIISIKSAFEKEGVADVFRTERGICSVNISQVECDYYWLLKNPLKYSVLFNGEYMFNYPWGEDTLAYLTQVVKTIHAQKEVPACMMCD